MRTELAQRIKWFLKAWSNIHRQGPKKNIYLFATPRGGSTWVMEVIASQPGMKYYDEPLNIRRDNVKRVGLFSEWKDLMPGGRDDMVLAYLRDLERNKYAFMNPPPSWKNHQFVTNRIVFKIHEVEHLMNRVRDELGGIIVYLLRHPIPTSLSRHQLPRLPLFLVDDYYRTQFLGLEASKAACALAEKGDPLQRAVLSWCYENVLALRSEDQPGPIFVTYEELVLNPRQVCIALAEALGLSNLDEMLTASGEPSSNFAMSNEETQQIMRTSNERVRRQKLVTKWQSKVDPTQEKQLLEILDIFQIDAYQCGKVCAQPRYLFDPEGTEAMIQTSHADH